MRIKLLSFLFAILLCAHNTHAQQGEVQFQVYAPSLPDTATVYISGSAAPLGNWNPAKVQLQFKGDHTWALRVMLDRSAPIEYKYTLGSWNREAVQPDGKPFPNFRLRDEIRDTVRFWASGKPIPKGKITGNVKYHRELKGPGLKNRDLVVWLPPGYEASRKNYPVIYMQDGQNVFDPVTSSFGADWQIDESADSLIRSGIIGPVIVVGIYNTPERSREYVPGDLGRTYMEFVVGTVKPFIDSAYRTKPGRKHTIAGGSSAGGILSFMLVWEYPDIFSKAISMSPAFKLPKGDAWNYVSTVKAEPKRKNVTFYIDNGGLGLEKLLQPGIDEMLNALSMKGYKEGKQFIFIPDPAAEHNEPAWAKRFPSALLWIMKR
jgi:predicted alpha/beta superfamily hydrolase